MIVEVYLEERYIASIFGGDGSILQAHWQAIVKMVLSAQHSTAFAIEHCSTPPNCNAVLSPLAKTHL